MLHTADRRLVESWWTVEDGPELSGYSVESIIQAMDKPLARGFVLVTDPKATTFTIYGRHRCEAQVPGTVATGAGDTVRLAWVDAEGHVSIPSDRIEVTRTK